MTSMSYRPLSPVVMWMEQVLGLERYWEVQIHTQDVEKGRLEGSGLKSCVMWDPESGLMFANNEPAAPFFEASQIYSFCERHRGGGVQHVALDMPDLVETVGQMRADGAQFLRTPSTYYDLLEDRLERAGVGTIEENIDTLRELNILVDGGGPNSYLLQIFMPDAATLFDDPQAGPMFIELIQRKGSKGFGEGNFRALFESIENKQVIEDRD